MPIVECCEFLLIYLRADELDLFLFEQLFLHLLHLALRILNVRILALYAYVVGPGLRFKRFL